MFSSKKTTDPVSKVMEPETKSTTPAKAVDPAPAPKVTTPLKGVDPAPAPKVTTPSKVTGTETKNLTSSKMSELESRISAVMKSVEPDTKVSPPSKVMEPQIIPSKPWSESASKIPTASSVSAHETITSTPLKVAEPAGKKSTHSKVTLTPETKIPTLTKVAEPETEISKPTKVTETTDIKTSIPDPWKVVEPVTEIPTTPSKGSEPETKTSRPWKPSEPENKPSSPTKSTDSESDTSTTPKGTEPEITVSSYSNEANVKNSLIVVSNRLPFVLKRNSKTDKLERIASAGGLVTAVCPVVIKGKGMWVGWSGLHLTDPNEAIPESDPNDKTPTAGLKSEQVVTVNIDKPDIFDSYYNGCCNGTFWPLFHSMPGRASFSAEHWRNYVKVNQLFAKRTIEALQKCHKAKTYPGTPIVWIHDYHLMLAANWVREVAEEKDLACQLSFFLHIPFPPWDIFRLFPWADEILQGMLGCDMVGFHIRDYCLNFVDCCQRYLGCRVDRKNLLVEHGGRSVRIRPLPIGIPFDRFVELAQTAPRVLKTKQKIILGVDRLDYTKGLVNRLKAFEVLLERYPEHRGQVGLLQISVPSRTDVREYQDLKEEMDQLVGRINGRFTTANWSPIRYIYGCVGQDELAAFYRDAAVALVTPLRDGMNLVAKEFVACQINDPPGVLIVSPFAGAGEMMHEALLCNPYEIGEAADVIHRALIMPEDERTLRMSRLRKREREYDVNQWMRMFLKAMGSLEEDDVGVTTLQPLTIDDFDDYLLNYVGFNHKLALLLDYDGTLAPIAPHPDLATLPPETKNILQRLSNHSDAYVVVISGRNVENVKKMVGIENITYAGNHGLEILHPDGSKFVHPMPTEYESKVSDLLKSLQDSVCRDGAWVENKGALLTFHYRETKPELRKSMVEKARFLIEHFGFRAAEANMALEARPPVEWNKGRASIYILRTAFGVDWGERVKIIYAGDDITDEDAMVALKGIAATFRVTSSQITKTSAERRLPSTDSVLTMLKWVERHFMRRKPRANSLTYRSKKKDAVKMHMSFDLEPDLVRITSNNNSDDDENKNK